ncbi:hypothetical protein [Rhizobium sp. 21-4511-3d]
MTNRYDAVAVRRYKDNQGNDKATFTTIGVAFAMRDKDGYTVRLNAVPAPVDGEFVILLMPPKEKGETRSGGQSRGEAQGRQANFSQDMDDDIPFAPEFR